VQELLTAAGRFTIDPFEPMIGVSMPRRLAVRRASSYQREVASTTCTPRSTAARSASALPSDSLRPEFSSVPSRSSAMSLYAAMRIE
jgi:hypothetical protein